MSYFDHVRCHGCKAQLDPESLAPGMKCPQCGVELSLPDLFGLKAAFDEDAPPDVSLDDLVPAPPRPAARPVATPPAPKRPAGPSTAVARPTPAADAPEPEPGLALRAMRGLKGKKR